MRRVLMTTAVVHDQSLAAYLQDHPFSLHLYGKQQCVSFKYVVPFAHSLHVLFAGWCELVLNYELKEVWSDNFDMIEFWLILGRNNNEIDILMDNAIMNPSAMTKRVKHIKLHPLNAFITITNPNNPAPLLLLPNPAHNQILLKLQSIKMILFYLKTKWACYLLVEELFVMV
jgi:hypothetical protein